MGLGFGDIAKACGGFRRNGGEMKDFTLEDMTKPELIKIIKQSLAYQPTQDKMRWVRWESMSEESQALMDEAVKEEQLYFGKNDMESRAKWMKASDKFDRGMKQSEKADVFLEDIRRIER